MIIGLGLTADTWAAAAMKRVYVDGKIAAYCEVGVDVDAVAQRAARTLANGAADVELLQEVDWQEVRGQGENPLNEKELYTLLTRTQPLSVRYSRIQVSFEAEKYETVFLEDETKYIDEWVVLLGGTDGEARVTTLVTFENGRVVSEEPIRRETVKAPSSRVVYIGTRKREMTEAAYVQPVYGRLTSDYGWRKGEFHTGVDIGVDKGTPICAAAEGTVIFAGRKGNYGNYVQIQHEDGVVTAYAHNSSLRVRQGDWVLQGQQIALAGDTGRSTGVHCHFEVIVDEEFQNPHDYVDFTFEED